MPRGVENPGRRAGAYREGGPIRCGLPAFRQPQGEDEGVHLLEGAARGGKVLRAVQPIFLRRRKASRLYLWTEWVEPGAVWPLPGILLRLEAAISTPDQLQQLTGGVNVAVAGAVAAIVEEVGHLVRQDGMRRLGHQEGEAALLQPPGDMLGEAASGRHHLILRPEPKWEVHHRVGGPAGCPDRLAPKPVGRSPRVGMCHSTRFICASTRAP